MIRICRRCGTRNRIPPARLAQAGRCGACKTPLDPVSEPLEVGPREFDEVVGGAAVPVLVDFWAPWCAPCRAMAPEVEAVARERAGRALVLKVDTEVWPELSARFGLQAIPSFLVFRNGRIVSRHVGAAPRAELVRWLDEASENRRNPRWT